MGLTLPRILVRRHYASGLRLYQTKELGEECDPHMHTSNVWQFRHQSVHRNHATHSCVIEPGILNTELQESLPDQVLLILTEAD